MAEQSIKNDVIETFSSAYEYPYAIHTISEHPCYKEGTKKDSQTLHLHTPGACKLSSYENYTKKSLSQDYLERLGILSNILVYSFLLNTIDQK